MTLFALWLTNTPELGMGLIILAAFLLTFARQTLLRTSGWLVIIGILMHFANYPNDRDNWIGCAIALAALVIVNRVVVKITEVKPSS